MKSALVLGSLLLAACYESHGLRHPAVDGDDVDVPELESEQASNAAVSSSTPPEQAAPAAGDIAAADNQLHPVVGLTDDVTNCASGKSFTERLDMSSTSEALQTYGTWYFDAYVFTAQASGTVSIWSQTRGVGESYSRGYAYPLSGQVIPDGVVAPQPGFINLVSSLPDNANDDGSARLDLTVEKGKRYVVAYKGLVGPATKQAEWDYDLSFCSNELSLEGKLWRE